jgi:hypothetical protein
MREQKGSLIDFYVAPNGAGHGDGSLNQPFSSFDEALVGIAARHAGQRPSVRPVVGYDQIEIATRRYKNQESSQPIASRVTSFTSIRKVLTMKAAARSSPLGTT